MDNLINKGRFDPNRIWGIILGALAIGAITFFLLREDHQIMAFLLLILFGYLLLKSILNYKAITIYENGLQVRWLFGLITTTVNKENIHQFGRSTHQKSDHIYIKIKKYELLLEEQITDNNELIIEQLRAWRIKRKDNIALNEFSRQLGQKAYGIFLMAFSLFFLGLLILNLATPTFITNETAFATISGYLQHTPEIKKTRGKSSVRDVIFYVGKYPGIKFSAGNTGYYLMDHKRLAECRPGDSITLLITQNDYEKKIVRGRENGNIEEYSGWITIDVYAVTIENKQLQTLQAYKDRIEDDKHIHPVEFVLIIAFGVALFIWGIKEFRK